MDDYSDFPRKKTGTRKRHKKWERGCLTRMSGILGSSIPFCYVQKRRYSRVQLVEKRRGEKKIATESRENGFCTHVAKKGRAVVCCLDVVSRQ